MAATAKIFMHGRSQAVRLPKEFRLPGKEVRVTQVGEAVLLEPIDETKPFDAEAFWAKIDALGARDFPAIDDGDLRPGLDADVRFD
jgi:antitoxin VapB